MFIVEIESFSNVLFNILTMGKMQRIWGMYEKLGKSEKNTISSNRKKESAVDRAGEHKKNSKDSIGFEALQPLHISQRKMKEMINGGCNPKQVAQRDLAHVCNNTEKVSNPAKVNQHKSNQQLNKYISIAGSQKTVAQRYTIKEGHRIANDHTAAVKEGKNNKLLYATTERISESNLAMNSKQMPLSLNQGSQKNGLVEDKTLYSVTPEYKGERVKHSGLPDSLTPKSCPTHKVLLPSECEKGAISIVGSFTKTKRSEANTRVYHDKDHANARIGELLAQSTADGGVKDTWYTTWSTFDEGRDKAAKSYKNISYSKSDKVFIFDTTLNDPGLSKDFLKKFKENDDKTKFVPNFVYSSDKRGREFCKKVVYKFDEKIAEVETEIMKTVATDTLAHKTELITAADLRDKLKNFFDTGEYPKKEIDEAIAMVPNSAGLLQALNKFREDSETKEYVSKDTLYKQKKVKVLAEKVLMSISKHVANLTGRNTRNIGSGTGLNTGVNPDIGQSYGIIGGNYDSEEGGRWNWHWASVIMKPGEDNVTMEAHASHKQGKEAHNHRWDFKMYGALANSGQTFHDEWKGDGVSADGFGKGAVTVLGVMRDKPALQGKVEELHIDGLGKLDTQAAKTSSASMLLLMIDLKDDSKSKDDLVSTYGAGPVTDNLPDLFVQKKLTAKLEELKQAMTKLTGGVGNEAKNKKAVNAKADDLFLEIAIFYKAVSNYERHNKLNGTFV